MKRLIRKTYSVALLRELFCDYERFGNLTVQTSRDDETGYVIIEANYEDSRFRVLDTPKNKYGIYEDRARWIADGPWVAEIDAIITERIKAKRMDKRIRRLELQLLAAKAARNYKPYKRDGQ